MGYLAGSERRRSKLCRRAAWRVAAAPGEKACWKNARKNSEGEEAEAPVRALPAEEDQLEEDDEEDDAPSEEVVKNSRGRPPAPPELEDAEPPEPRNRPASFEAEAKKGRITLVEVLRPSRRVFVVVGSAR